MKAGRTVVTTTVYLVLLAAWLITVSLLLSRLGPPCKCHEEAPELGDVAGTSSSSPASTSNGTGPPPATKKRVSP